MSELLKRLEADGWRKYLTMGESYGLIHPNRPGVRLLVSGQSVTVVDDVRGKEVSVDSEGYTVRKTVEQRKRIPGGKSLYEVLQLALKGERV